LGKRIYIYRSGATDNFALTGAKEDPRLPPAVAPDSWRFWMQIGPHQGQDNLYGFGIEDAVNGIVTTGYYLFRGSQVLQSERPLAKTNPPSRGEQADA
jgi:hypothetical protein